MAAENEVTVLLEKLAQPKDASVRANLLRNIAILGERANSAGPAVVKLLSDENWDVRVAAARTLGYIGMVEAAGELIELLDRKDDWRLVFVAAESLGKLRVKQAEPALSSIWNSHWYLPVRDAAGRAIDAIHGKEPPRESPSREQVMLDFFSYRDDRENFETLSFGDEFRVRFPIVVLCNEPRSVKVLRKDGGMRTERHLGTNTDDGYLIATDEESGGAMEFVDRKGNAQLLAEEKTKAIYGWGDDYLAVTDPTRPNVNCGFIYKLKRNPEGKWTAAKFRRLPGEPTAYWMLKGRRMLVGCTGGIVVVSVDGDVEFYTRDKAVR
jgi:hypothetical protein